MQANGHGAKMSSTNGVSESDENIAQSLTRGEFLSRSDHRIALPQQAAPRVAARLRSASYGVAAFATMGLPSRSWRCQRRLVPRKGLEPSRLAPLVPETSASTNS